MAAYLAKYQRRDYNFMKHGPLVPATIIFRPIHKDQHPTKHRIHDAKVNKREWCYERTRRPQRDCTQKYCCTINVDSVWRRASGPTTSHDPVKRIGSIRPGNCFTSPNLRQMSLPIAPWPPDDGKPKRVELE